MNRDDHRPDTGDLNTLFVYGIFLGADNRNYYGMTNPRYDVVRGYATVIKHGSIVEAVDCDQPELGLTGLRVTVDPEHWARIDDLEYGYDRRKVTTVDDREAWIYVRHQD